MEFKDEIHKNFCMFINNIFTKVLLTCNLMVYLKKVYIYIYIYIFNYKNFEIFNYLIE